MPSWSPYCNSVGTAINTHVTHIPLGVPDTKVPTKFDEVDLEVCLISSSKEHLRLLCS